MGLGQNFKQSTPLGYIALIRIAVGYHFLTVALPKLQGGYLSGRGMANQLAAGIAKDPFAWHQAFIRNQVLPNAHIFNYLTAFGELAIALSLLSGCLVRISSLFAAFYQANIYLSLAVAVGGATLGLNRIFILLELIFFASAAGRALGLDGILKKAFPRSWLF